MTDQSNDPRWLDEFEDLANRQLEEGSSCDQIHPIVERWFQGVIQGDPPESRPSVTQAVSCLATEVLHNSPENMVNTLLEHMAEDDLAQWIEHILLIGRAFEIGLNKGDLDDL